MSIFTGLIGLVLALAWFGALTWAISDWSFTLITGFVTALFLFDFVRIQMYERNGDLG
jgi:hypothetical protein